MKKIKVAPMRNGGSYKRGEFTDGNGVSCSIQESSALGRESLLWLGANDIGLKVGMPWRDVSEDQIAQAFGATTFMGDSMAVIANSRMHLTQSQVKALLPLLTKFAKTGRL